MMERYKPTQQEVVNSKFQPDKLKVSGDGIFYSFQGEGVSIGKPAVFLRLQDCNLTCGRPTGWLCDTPYTWQKDKAPYWQEPKNVEIKDLSKQVKEAWKGEGKPRLVITGGEPMMQQRNVVNLVERLFGWDIEIETNGTIAPLRELGLVQFNVSPKLSNSGNVGSRRYKPDVLKTFNMLPKTNFKFVVASQGDVAEIQSMVIGAGLDKNKIYVMPEGITTEALDKHKQLVETFVNKEGYKMTDRLQIRRYGQKRRV